MPVLNSPFHQETMTPLVNEIEAASSFLRNALYPRSKEKLLGTSRVRIDNVIRRRVAAPFVLTHAEGIMMPGREANGVSYETPNIRIKRPFQPDDLIFSRGPGEQLFITPGQDVVREHVMKELNEHLVDLVDMIHETEEWMVSRSLQGAISYEVADQEAFTLDFNRSHDCNVALTHTWDSYYPSDPEPLMDIQLVKSILNSKGMPAATDAILGSEAVDAFLRLIQNKVIKVLDANSLVSVGSATFRSQFESNGAQFLGNISGVNFWGYTRTTQFADQSNQIPLIRPKYAEFVNLSSNADRVMYYGAIPDLQAIKQNRHRNRIFSKSWEIQDPSGQMTLVHSRPLPVPRRPNESVSVKVVSG